MARKRILSLFLAALSVLGLGVAVAQAAGLGGNRTKHGQDETAGGGSSATATPIKHLVVIFQENVSFDHYFGTYPHATNPSNEPAFNPAPDTPTVNGLTGALLTRNPNTFNPRRLDRSQALTCDQNHDYTAEQNAYDHGAMDRFVESTNTPTCTTNGAYQAPDLVMDYYDGNTVTGMWNYAQHFAMSDNSYSTTFGPSTPGALNVIAGNTFGAACGGNTGAVWPATVPPCPSPTTTTTGGTAGHPDPQGPGTTYSDSDPAYDICSAGATIGMGGANVGDLLSNAGVTWGWFQGGFADKNYIPGQPNTDKTPCNGSHTNIAGNSVTDYSAHHEPFEYYRSTANPQHLPPSSVAMVGRQDQANHQYDLKDFWAAADSGNLPAVSYLKAPRYQDGHPGYSDPLDEQTFIVNTINHLEQLPSWRSTAVVIAYDDSDGWYDHQFGPVTTQSQTPLDTLTGPGQCGANPKNVPSGQQARCGVGMRQPLLVISPFSRHNFVDNTFTDQSSVVRFIEDNWLGGQRVGAGSADAWAGELDRMFQFGSRHPGGGRLFLDPTTGEPVGGRDGYGGGDGQGGRWDGKRR